MPDRIDYHEESRTLCAVSTWRETDKPEVIESWFPIFKTHRITEWEHVIGKPATYDRGTHTYSVRLESVYRPIVFALEQGGNTRSIDFRRIPIPAPKVRKGTRLEYRDGFWRKLLAKGWAIA